MSQQAKVTQIDALREFRAALVVYLKAVRDGSDHLLHEGRRGVSWVQDDRPVFWPAEVRRLDNALVEAKAALEQCQARQMIDQRRSCIDEKKAITRVKGRLERARDKVKLSRSWKGKIARDGNEFETRLVQLGDFADTELPKAIAAMDRIIEALDKYASKADGPPRTDSGPTPQSPKSQSNDASASETGES